MTKKYDNKKKTAIYGIVTLLTPWITVCFICYAAFLFLYQKNSDVLFMAQLRSLFIEGNEYFNTCMQRPGGLLVWAATWATQLFYDSKIGVTALAVIWAITFLLTKKAFGLQNWAAPLAAIPVVCLAASVIDLGYWLYYIRMQGYFFSESIGFLITAALIALPGAKLRILPEKTGQSLSIAAVIAALAYPFIGYFSVLTLACIAIREAAKRNYLSSIVAICLTIVAPLLFRQCYDTMRPDETYTIGFPVFECGLVISSELQQPFIFAIATMLILSFAPLLTRFHAKKSKEKELSDMTKALMAVVLQLIVIAGGYSYLQKVNVTDDNYHAECKAYRAVEEFRWDDVLDIIDATKGDITRQLLTFKDIALFHSGDIGNRKYHYKDVGVKPNVSDSLHVNLSEIAGPVIYLHHGQTNYAYRWCMENSVEFGLNITNLKVMTLASLIGKDYKVAEKYLDILSKTMHYKEWAAHYRSMIANPKLLEQQPELVYIRNIRKNLINNTQSDNSLCEKFLVDTYSQLMTPNSPELQEMTLIYSLISKDIQLFWPHFMLYAQHLGNKTMPIHYQEAAFLYGNLEPQSMDISRMPFDKERIIDRYASFQQRSQELLANGMTPESVGSAMWSDYGDTFWWSYFFDRGSVYY